MEKKVKARTRLSTKGDLTCNFDRVFPKTPLTGLKDNEGLMQRRQTFRTDALLSALDALRMTARSLLSSSRYIFEQLSMKTVGLFLILVSSSCADACLAQGNSTCGTPFAFTAERLVLPITVVNDFVFLSAEVNGTQGKVMLDTGTLNALVLNDHLLKQLGPGKVEGQGRVGSGQTYMKTVRDCVHAVSISGLQASDVPSVESEDLGFIEKDITPDFLGFVGYRSFTEYALELDYGRRRLTLEKSMRGARPVLLQDEKILATLPFTTRRRPDDPFISVKLGGESFIAAFDKGQSGLLEMNADLRERLIKAGSLTVLPGKDEDGNLVYRVNDLELAPGLHISLPAMTIHAPGSITDKGIGIQEKAVIYLGFQVLSQFKAAWDWPNQTIYLLKP